jgi:hypothetical protein
MRHANFIIVSQNQPDYVLIQDIGPWDIYPTVTNDAECVVSDLAPNLNGRRLDYIDSEGVRGTLLVKDGKFAGFA